MEPKNVENVIIIKCNCQYFLVVVKTAVAHDYLRVLFVIIVFLLSLMSCCSLSGLLCLSAPVVQTEAILQTAAQL